MSKYDRSLRMTLFIEEWMEGLNLSAASPDVVVSLPIEMPGVTNEFVENCRRSAKKASCAISEPQKGLLSPLDGTQRHLPLARDPSTDFLERPRRNHVRQF